MQYFNHTAWKPFSLLGRLYATATNAVATATKTILVRSPTIFSPTVYACQDMRDLNMTRIFINCPLKPDQMEMDLP